MRYEIQTAYLGCVRIAICEFIHGSRDERLRNRVPQGNQMAPEIFFLDEKRVTRCWQQSRFSQRTVFCLRMAAEPCTVKLCKISQSRLSAQGSKGQKPKETAEIKKKGGEGAGFDTHFVPPRSEVNRSACRSAQGNKMGT